MASTSYPPRIGRRNLLGASAAGGLGLLCPSPRAALACQQPPGPTLLVRGETRLSGAPMAWRVVRDVAETPPDAAFERRALGFAVATNPFASLLLTDEATGSAARLAPGEAAFVRDGTFQRRESLGTGAQSYLRIGLAAAASARDAGGDRLLFAGPAFTVSPGPVALVLFRVSLEPGDAFGVPPGAGETLVVVEQGEAELEVGEAAPRDRLQTVVGSDTSYAIRSVPAAATLYGQVEGTRVLVATIRHKESS